MSQTMLLAIAWAFMVGATALNLVFARSYVRMIQQYSRLNLLLANCCVLAWTMRGWIMPNLLDCHENAADDGSRQRPRHHIED
jgi:hypothetical protein